MKLATTILFALTLLIVFVQLFLGKYDPLFYPILWILVNLMPVLYLLHSRAGSIHPAYALGYALLLLLTILGQLVMLITQGIGANEYLLVSTGWLALAQLGIWFASHGYRSEQLLLRSQTAQRERQSTSDEIMSLITDNKLSDAVRRLKGLPDLSPAQSQEIVNYSLRFHELERLKRLRLIDHENLQIERNQLVQGIIEFVGGLRG